MTTRLIHPATDAVYDAVTDEQVEAMATLGWEPAGIDVGLTVEGRHDLLVSLAEVPDEKAALLAFRDEHGLEADGRLGEEAFRTAIVEAIDEITNGAPGTDDQSED